MNRSTYIRLGFVTLPVLSVMIFCTTSMAQSKVESYLKRKDANQNGRIEPEEMSENTKNYLRKVGYDPSKPISIAKVVAKDAKSKSSAARAAKQGNVVRKVPGFGVDAGEKQGVQSFSYNSNQARGATSGGGRAQPKYSDKVMEQVRSTLDRYDRNKDGALDKSEQARARWGSPKPETNDLNKDGRLSSDELAKRYAGRESYYRDSRSSSSSSSSSSASKRAEEERARRDRDRQRRTSSARSSSSSSSSRSRSASTTSSSTAKPKVDRSKYLKYAQSLIENYDKDKDGKLSKDEVKAMRRPPVGADTDKDGFITENELVDSLSGANKKSSSGSTASSSSAKSKYSSRSRSTSSSSRSRSRTSSSMKDLDENGDNQIQMHEFASADEWDDKVLAEYYSKDKNGDGVITSREWSAR